MSKVDAINSYKSSPYSVFGALAQGVTVGAGLGYAAKYLLPVDSNELSSVDKEYIKIIREQSNRAKSVPIEAIRSLDSKTPAQDTFLKMVEKQGDSNTMRNIAKIANLDSNGKEELRNIIRQVNQKASNTAKLHIKAYMKAVKMEKRSTMAYILAGAVTGFFGGLVKKIITG